VLEPEYRGSRGYGDRHYRASFKQMGLAMQDDVADGARWAIAQGIAESGRICIAGGGYGGYSALMGLANDADLYKCGINWMGMTDIEVMFDPGYRTSSFDYLERSMPVLIGDREKDAALLKAASPIHHAARIKQPLLLAYGGYDRSVPIVHGVRFRDAVRKSNADVEWVEYAEEGHGLYLVKNRVDFWARVEKFLQRNIGSP
jgi:dipeptidyl aminopeptidase/acylaminoacyl peptidase